MSTAKRRRYKREWLRRKRAGETPDERAARYVKKNADRNAKRWAANPNSKRVPAGQCKACKRTFPHTAEFFQPMVNKAIGWTGLSSECRECRKARFRIFYAANREEQIERAGEYQRLNPIPKRNRDMIRYMRRKKLGGCPPWADQRQLQTIYAIAEYLTRVTGVEYQVDHYYPLMHPTSCGLHVPWNLRVITAAANRAKGNKLPT